MDGSTSSLQVEERKKESKKNKKDIFFFFQNHNYDFKLHKENCLDTLSRIKLIKKEKGTKGGKVLFLKFKGEKIREI